MCWISRYCIICLAAYHYQSVEARLKQEMMKQETVYMWWLFELFCLTPLNRISMNSICNACSSSRIGVICYILQHLKMRIFDKICSSILQYHNDAPVVDDASNIKPFVLSLPYRMDPNHIHQTHSQYLSINRTLSFTRCTIKIIVPFLSLHFGNEFTSPPLFNKWNTFQNTMFNIHAHVLIILSPSMGGFFRWRPLFYNKDNNTRTTTEWLNTLTIRCYRPGIATK